MTVMPVQKPGRSEQIVCTPPEFIEAVTKRFGGIGWDLAALAENSVMRNTNRAAYFGPDHANEENRDSLKVSWGSAALQWLNPPFGNIAPWAEKAASCGSRVAMLVPASVGSNWFRDHVHGKAFVLALSPRLKFVGHASSFPKDLMLCIYGLGVHGFDVWRWL